MDKRTALQRAYKQLAIEFNTTTESLESGGVIFTLPAMNPGRRMYSDKLPFFEMATIGRATVIMADERLHTGLRQWAEGADEPHWLFELPRMLRLSGLLEPYGYELTQTFHHYLPYRPHLPAEPPEGLELCWIEREGIAGFYPNEAWPNALQGGENLSRPDVLALAAMAGGHIAALAGASIDAAGTEDMQGLWQIGIDVRPEYQGRGLGALLVRGLAAEIERRGELPFYGTSLSNIHSQNIAWNTGFFPAWVAVSAKQREK